jgi:hypothetical protein
MRTTLPPGPADAQALRHSRKIANAGLFRSLAEGDAALQPCPKTRHIYGIKLRCKGRVGHCGAHHYKMTLDDHKNTA